MSAFHVNDGVPASGDKHLLSDILRGEWGFDGFVVSDYGIVSEMHSGHGVCESVKDAAALAANAGLDMDMMANAYLKYLKELIDEGRVAMALVDEAVRRIIRIKFRCGLFEHPYADESLPVKVLLAPNHVALARTAAAASTVLLRNTGVLPLTPDQGKILVTGPFARARSELFGCWTLDGRAEDATALCDAIKTAAGAGCSVHVDNEACFGDLTLMLALRADVVIACIGEAPWRSGEGNSIAAIDLPTGQLEMLKHIHALGKPIIAVVFAGRPLAISWLEEHCDAVLYAWHPGIEAGNAVADILFGRVEPSGRLPVSFPRSSGHIPAHYYHRPTHRPGTLWNDNAWYRDAKHTPLYPFGFGLGYTTFKYRDLKVSPTVAALNGTVGIEVTVENTGPRKGTETVQLYVRDLKASVSRPVKELKGFTQVTLKPAESRRVQFTLASSDLSFTGIDMRATVEAGEFKVWVGPNSAEGLESGFELR